MKKLISIFMICVFFLFTGCEKKTEFDLESKSETSTNTKKDEKKTESEIIQEFSGIPALKGSLGVSALNNKESAYQGFCCGGEKVFFANPRDGQFLYSYDGDKLALLADMPVYCLYYYEGTVYFLSDGSEIKLTDNIGQKGYLYGYNTDNNKLTRLSDFIMRDLSVNESGIFYIQESEDGIALVCGFDPDTGEGTPLYSCFFIHNYHGYHIFHISENGEIKVGISNGGESYLLPVDGMPRRDCIVDGIYYYRPQGEKILKTIDLGSGKCEDIIIPEDYGFSDYTVFKGTVYLLLNGDIYAFINREMVLVKDGAYDFIYSGSDALYAMQWDFEKGPNVYDFVEIGIDEDAGTVRYKNITSEK